MSMRAGNYPRTLAGACSPPRFSVYLVHPYREKEDKIMTTLSREILDDIANRTANEGRDYFS